MVAFVVCRGGGLAVVLPEGQLNNMTQSFAWRWLGVRGNCVVLSKLMISGKFCEILRTNIFEKLWYCGVGAIVILHFHRAPTFYEFSYDSFFWHFGVKDCENWRQKSRLEIRIIVYRGSDIPQNNSSTSAPLRKCFLILNYIDSSNLNLMRRN